MNIGVIFAGGIGNRMHSKDIPKQFLRVFDKPIIIRTLDFFEKNGHIDNVVVSCLESHILYLTGLVDEYGLKKIKKIVPGGESGQLSIYNGLLAAKEIAGNEPSIVLIHDGVRPLISENLITRNIETVYQKGNCITAGIVKETIVEINDAGIIQMVPSRKNSRVAKAPQSFWLDDILSVHEMALKDGINNSIDSCTLMNQYGKTLHMIDGPFDNIKITTQDDFFSMRAILESRENSQIYVE